jgi:hypothetical protein
MRTYLALDESNHGRDPEVIAGFFSFIDDDATVHLRRGQKRMEERDLIEFSKNPRRSWRIAAIPRDQLKRRFSPLVQALPCIVKDFVGLGSVLPIDLDVQFDGELRNRDMVGVLEGLKECSGIRVVGVRSYAKCCRSRSDYPYTRLLEAADALANRVFRKIYGNRRIYEINIMRGGALL